MFDSGDDDTVVRKLVCRAVKMVAPTWTIREAANGETALQLVSEEGYMPDLIFMDMCKSFQMLSCVLVNCQVHLNPFHFSRHGICRKAAAWDRSYEGTSFTRSNKYHLRLLGQ